MEKYGSEPNVVVDLRNKFPAIRDQGSRPLCLVFAASDLNAFIQNSNEMLSVEYLSYYSYIEDGQTDYTKGLTSKAVTRALENHGQPCEIDLPYAKSAIIPPSPPGDYNNLFYAIGREQIDLVDSLIKSLDQGCATIILAGITQGFFNPKGSNVISDKNGSLANHALVVVGYGKYPDNECCFLIRNSWGESWANGGYAWLTSEYISNKVFISLRLSKKI